MNKEIKFLWGKFTPEKGTSDILEVLKKEIKISPSLRRKMREFLVKSFEILPDKVGSYKILHLSSKNHSYDSYMVVGVSVYRPDIKYIRRYIILDTDRYLPNREISIIEGDSILYNKEIEEIEEEE